MFQGSDAMNEKLFDMVRETHAVYLSQTTVKGQYVIRVSVNSAQATGDDVRDIYKVLSQQASSLLDGRKSQKETDMISVEKPGRKPENPDRGSGKIEASIQ